MRKSTRQTSEASIFWVPEQMMWAVRTPYSKEFVEDFKAQVPRSLRSWNPEAKVWTIDDAALETVKDLTSRYFGAFDFIPKQIATPTNGDGDAFREFLEILGKEEVHKIWRSAMMRLHTDQGGSHDTAARFNAAWQKIEGVLK